MTRTWDPGVQIQLCGDGKLCVMALSEILYPDHRQSSKQRTIIDDKQRYFKANLRYFSSYKRFVLVGTYNEIMQKHIFIGSEYFPVRRRLHFRPLFLALDHSVSLRVT